jgi:ABC-2 type transport system permease protein
MSAIAQPTATETTALDTTATTATTESTGDGRSGHTPAGGAGAVIDRPRHRPDQPAPRVTLRGVLLSEWVKLRSLRSSVTTLGASGAIMVLVGVIFAAILGGVLSGGGGDLNSEFANNPAGAALQGTMLAQLVIGVLGVMLITSEYATGTIRNTLAVVPKRLPVLWAKVIVTAVVSYPTVLVASLIAFFAGQALIGSGGIATASLGDPGVLGAVLGTAGYLTGVALLGLAVGTLLRSTAVAISTLFGVIFLLPGLGQLLLPASWKDNVLQYLPSNAATSFTSVHHVAGTLSTGAGTAVFLAWIIVPLAAAAVLLKRRTA